MRSIASLALLLILIGNAHAQNYDNEAATEHLRILWNDGDADADIVERLSNQGERFYASITERLQQEPGAPIILLLQGPAEKPNAPRGYPHVDNFGNIHLYTYGPGFDSYLSPLAHEMVHVFRMDRRGNRDWFAEEGIAEFIALRVDPSLDGFPWYGTTLVVAAGQWVASNEAIPLDDLRTRHKELNQPCKAQSYTLRASFFVYLGDRYGDDKVLAFARKLPAGSLEDYEEFFGLSFGGLEAQWRTDLMDEYNSIEDVAELSRRYRKNTPIQYMPVCPVSKNDP